MIYISECRIYIPNARNRFGRNTAWRWYEIGTGHWNVASRPNCRVHTVFIPHSNRVYVPIPRSYLVFSRIGIAICIFALAAYSSWPNLARAQLCSVPFGFHTFSHYRKFLRGKQHSPTNPRSSSVRRKRKQLENSTEACQQQAANIQECSKRVPAFFSLS